MGYGKWIGGIVGFMAAGPLGALAGYAIGSMLKTIMKIIIVVADTVVVHLTTQPMGNATVFFSPCWSWLLTSSKQMEK